MQTEPVLCKGCWAGSIGGGPEGPDERGWGWPSCDEESEVEAARGPPLELLPPDESGAGVAQPAECGMPFGVVEDELSEATRSLQPSNVR